MVDVLVELGGRVVDRRTVPRADQRQLALAQPAQRRQVGGQRARIRGDEHAPLPQHGVAGHRDVPGEVRKVVGRVPGRGHRLQRTERAALRQANVDVAACGAELGLGEPRADRGHRLGVVGVVVGKRDPTEPSTALDLSGHGFHMLGQPRPRVDQPSRVAADDPRVGARQRERPRVRRANPDQLVSGKLDSRHRRCASSHPRSRQVPTPPPATRITCRAPWACSSDVATAARCPEEQITATGPAASISPGIPARS